MVPSRPLTWRIQNIPADFTEERLKSCFHSDDKLWVDIKSLVPDVSNYDGDGTLTATILFSPLEPREPRIEEYLDLDMDKDFIGFTPLNNPDKDVCADIIAVTGLAGHAFGSWGHSAQKMWLRDYLPRDIKNRARILIYGYESQLHGANTAKSIISDYGNSFTQSLMDLRDHPSCRDRPLILIGHSLGALIIKQAITDLEPSIRSRLPVRTLIFFGAPHNGLEVTALETLVKGRPTQMLVSELKRESPTLTGLSERFRHVAKNMTIHTYYESRPTSTVAEGPDGIWARRGEALVMVERSSALLNVEPEKTRMKVDGDHKEIARLRRGQSGVYPNVLRIIKEALVSASDQFTATTTRAAQAAEIETKEAWVDEPDLGVSVETEADEADEEPWVDEGPGDNFDEDTTAEDSWDYDEDNLICDSCCDEFPKTREHQHCYICDSGNYNVCQACNANGISCPGGHDMVSRQLEADDDDDDEEEEEGEAIAGCDICGYDFYERSFYFYCRICNDGDFYLCLACRKAGRICVMGHKLVKSHDPLDQADNTSITATNADAEETNEETEYCDVAGCECSLPKRPKTPVEEPQQYCDVAGCECSLPKRPTTPVEEPQKFCSIDGCECSLPRMPPVKELLEKYCNVSGCECNMPKLSSLSLSDSQLELVKLASP